MNPPQGTGNLPGGGLVYRGDAYLFNQLYVSIGKKTNGGQGSVDIGAQVDLVYGTDYVFLRSFGLEMERDSSNRWNSDGGNGLNGTSQYGLAMPQAFIELAYESVTLRLGHFYNILGHEGYIPTQDFYYTFDYSVFYNGYGESRPVTGMLAEWQLSPQWLIGGGFHRGTLRWDDNNDILNVVGLVEWTPLDDVILTYTVDVGAEDDAGDNTVFTQSLIFEWQFTKRSSYILNAPYGFEQNVATGGGTAYWYGFSHYLAYQVHEKLVAGLRYGMFHDVDGIRVSPRAGFPANAPGMYHGVTVGLNYLPSPNIIVRPEVRWNWFDADGQLPPGPFENGSSRSQFLASVDLTLSF